MSYAPQRFLVISLVSDANHSSIVRICIVMFACRTRRGRTLSALVPLLSRLSGLSRSAAIARVSRLAGISCLTRRALLS